MHGIVRLIIGRVKSFRRALGIFSSTAFGSAIEIIVEIEGFAVKRAVRPRQSSTLGMDSSSLAIAPSGNGNDLTISQNTRGCDACFSAPPTRTTRAPCSTLLVSWTTPRLVHAKSRLPLLSILACALRTSLTRTARVSLSDR